MERREAHTGGVHDELYHEVRDLVFYRGEPFMAGAFAQAGEPKVTLNSIGRFDGQTWRAMGDGFKTFGIREHVSALVPYGDGVFATGTFRGEDGSLGHVAWWDGERWHPLGEGLSDLGSAMLWTPKGLWLSGPFTTAGDKSTYGLALWEF